MGLLIGAILLTACIAPTTEPIGAAQQEMTSDSFVLYLALSNTGDTSCTFGAVEGCQLFEVPTTAIRDGSGNFDVRFDENELVEVLPGIPATAPSTSPDGTQLTFLVTRPVENYAFRGLYIYDLETGIVTPLTLNETHNNQGNWPRWLSDHEIIYTNTNFCPQQNGPGCSIDSRYQDLLISTLNDTEIETLIAAGDLNPITQLDTRFCTAEDPAPNMTEPNLIGFHSGLVDGNTNAVENCPWLAGIDVPQPQPVVLNIDAAPSDGQVDSLVPGRDYWTFDLEGAGIHGCAHLDFGPNDNVVVCTEQTAPSGAHVECSIPGNPLESCRANGGHEIKYSRVFGFVEEDGAFRNLHTDESTTPLFQHLHPSELPNADRFWHEDLICGNYNTKYVELGPEDLLLASVLCVEETNGQTVFSRVMLIDISDPSSPNYFDITGWFEDQFPERWTSGSATGFTGSFGAQY